jgi:hypothetical protein
MITPRSMSMRMAATAGSLALAISAIAAPAVFAQDDSPEAAIQNLKAAIEAKDFESLPSFFCPEFAGDMGGLDIASMTEGMPEGMDVQSLFDLFEITVALDSVDVVSQTDTEAVVDMTGSMSIAINEAAIPGFVEPLIESMGEEVTPDMVEMFSGMMLSEFEAESTDMSAQLTLVPGASGGWLICSDLSGADATDAMDDDMADDMDDASPEATAGE